MVNESHNNLKSSEQIWCEVSRSMLACGEMRGGWLVGVVEKKEFTPKAMKMSPNVNHKEIPCCSLIPALLYHSIISPWLIRT
jgi:hypothetical protein